MNTSEQRSPSVVFPPGELCITEGETEYLKDIDGLNQFIVGLKIQVQQSRSQNQVKHLRRNFLRKQYRF